MTKHLFPLLLALLLCGCAPRNSLPDDPASRMQNSPALSQITAYPASVLEETSGGAFQVFPMGSDCIRKMLCVENTLVLLLETDSGLRLEQFPGDGSTGIPANGLRDGSLQVLEKGVSYFDEEQNQIVVLDPQLRELHRINVPEDLNGIPVLSRDGRLMYYCTAAAVRELDMTTGISRVIKESAVPSQSVTGLLLNGTVLQISCGQGKIQYLSSSSGQFLNQSGIMDLSTSGNAFRAVLHSPSGQQIILGNTADTPRVLLPRQRGSCLLSGDGAMILFYPDEVHTTLDYYDVNTGLRTAALTVPQILENPECMVQLEETIYFSAYSPEFGCHALFRWDRRLCSVEDTAVYTADYYTRSRPDAEGLAECAAFARELGNRYGIEIRIYQDAVTVQPRDYILEAEYQVPLLRRELELLEQKLQNFPEAFWPSLASNFTGMKLCIVGSICANGGTDPGSESGLPFTDGYDAYIALAAGGNTEYALYHALFHLIEGMVLTRSTAYDRWDTLNPANFAYDNDYVRNNDRDGFAWLQPGNEAFIDTYAMSFPKEDRARIFEYAMTEGNAHRFASATMQAKLQQLCLGIREAFRLMDYDSPLLWEQYLREMPES